MAKVRPLAHAPVVEALIDLRVHGRDGMTVERLETSLAAHDFGYQKKGPILRGNFGFSINLEETPLTPSTVGETAIIGTRLHSANEKYVAQLTIEGFTLSRLPPYESWDALVAEARRVWSVYVQCANPVRIHRAATRYINNLRLPLKQGERFQIYLKGLPDMPLDFPQRVSSFLQRFVVEDEHCGATAILTQALDQFTANGVVPVILDIDVFRDIQFSPDSADVWEYFSQLRSLKNRFFFGALEEAAVELYE